MNFKGNPATVNLGVICKDKKHIATPPSISIQQVILFIPKFSFCISGHNNDKTISIKIN